jgi:hypothetical protein
MTLEVNRDLIRLAEEEAARRLLRAAVYFQQAYKQRVSIPNSGERRRRTRNTRAGKKGSQYTVYPNPSKPGEYPRLITGHGRDSLTYAPSTVEGVIAAGLKIRVGFRKIIRHPLGNYMLILELFRDRKGLLEVLKETEPQLRALAMATAKRQ